MKNIKYLTTLEQLFLFTIAFLFFSCERNNQEDNLSKNVVRTLAANPDNVFSTICYLDGEFDNIDGLPVNEMGTVISTDSIGIKGERGLFVIIHI